MGVQNLLDFIVVGHAAEPAVQLDKQDNVDLFRLNVLQHPHKFFPVGIFLPGAFAFVHVHPGDGIVIRPGVLLQIVPLGLEGIALFGLLLCRYPDVQRRAADGRDRIFIVSHVKIPLEYH